MSSLQTFSACVGYSCSVVAAPGAFASLALCEVLDNDVFSVLIIEEFTSYPLAKVVHLACFLVRCGAQRNHFLPHDLPQ